MGHNEESKASLEYIDGNGKQSLHEGDYIICRNEDGSRHIGRIVLICGYQETEGAEPEAQSASIHQKAGRAIQERSSKSRTSGIYAGIQQMTCLPILRQMRPWTGTAS